MNGFIVARRQLSGPVAGTKGDIWISHRDTTQGKRSSNRSCIGLMDEIAVFNRALSASEVQEVRTRDNHGEPLAMPTPSDGCFASWMQ